MRKGTILNVTRFTKALIKKKKEYIRAKVNKASHKNQSLFFSSQCLGAAQSAK